MISIVIPVYNRASQLIETLDSIAKQTYKDWECIIVDDGSTDDTMSVAQQYVTKDKRFVCLKNVRKKGAQGARNTGIEAALGEWICLFDSDDIMFPNYLDVMIKNANEDVDVVVCQADIYDTVLDKKVGVLDNINSNNMLVDLLKGRIYVAYDVTLIRRTKLYDMDLLDESCPSMQERDTHIRLSKIAVYKSIDVSLCEWRVGGIDAISGSLSKRLEGIRYICLKHRKDFRKYAYRQYLNALYNALEKSDFSRGTYMKSPELIIYVPIKKVYTMFYNLYIMIIKKLQFRIS
jgi:glycosyltransferase involved in cell wall biosynthesis